ncbi:uncharacterized protein BYT42DRAFT_484297, partial [Radiomyces spectabilis]|uniref:uncharacterized protein n=1 Tax=Radiomyces spectabilis TaxID=64574 RepID=UPI0022210977
MIDRLVNHSQVDSIYPSYPCTSNECLFNRDQQETTRVPRTAGNTQDILRILSATEKSVAIVTIDYAGFSTNVNDLSTLVENHKCLQAIVVDNLATFHRSLVFTRQELL